MTTRHRRIGPDLDVALCGARGLYIYANTQKAVTCEACKAKYAALRGTNRMAEQMKAKRASERAGYSRFGGHRFGAGAT